MIGDSNRKTIGLVLENIFTDFAEEFIQNVASGIRQRKDLDLVIIAGKYDGNKDKRDNYHWNRLIYNSVYRLEELCKFDGLIICLGSMANIQQEDVNRRFFTKLSRVPKVFAVTETEEHVSVNYENESGIREAVECLVNMHGYTRFGMLGGREDNVDSRKRKVLFEKCLKDNGVEFGEKNYEMTDMSVNCRKEAGALLDRIPDIQAIFCVNDAVAAGLFEEMHARRLEPGRDIKVFGFDNTKMAGRMIPTLASIGADKTTLGRQSLELLLAMMNGEHVTSVCIPTRLYGRESFNYEMYEYSNQEMMNVDSDFIYRMFDDCFYRYRYEYIDREAVNLKRLFWEFMSRLLTAVKNRYMSRDEFRETCELIDIFFENGALEYTDAGKLLRSIDRIQGAINITQTMVSTSANMYINRLFTRMRDGAIKAQSDMLIREKESVVASRQNLQDFIIETTDYTGDCEDKIERLVSNFGLLGMQNAALFLFDEPTIYEEHKKDLFPDTIRFRCGIKDGELFVLAKERQLGLTSEMFRRMELPPKCRECVAFPIFSKRRIFGFLVCEFTQDVSSMGELVTEELGRVVDEAYGSENK